jgi:hypothetical protein
MRRLKISRDSFLLFFHERMVSRIRPIHDLLVTVYKGTPLNSPSWLHQVSPLSPPAYNVTSRSVFINLLKMSQRVGYFPR